MLACWFSLAAQAGPLPALENVPDQLGKDVRIELDRQKSAIKDDLAKFQADGRTFNAKRTEDQTDKEFDALEARRKRYLADAGAFNERVRIATEKHVIDSLTALAKHLEWDQAERDRLKDALSRLGLGRDGVESTPAQREQVWKDVLARKDDSFSKQASAGTGPGLPAAGTQSSQDCAVYALANATGVPYEVVAARATKLIEEGAHRNASDRANAQKAIVRGGLTGGEVIMLAEALGQAEVVASADFAKTLADGRRVMVNVSPGHEVVLSKTFQRGGQTWYEMLDSNQDEWRRLYWSAAELELVLEENGVAFRHDAKTTPRLLRKKKSP